MSSRTPEVLGWRFKETWDKTILLLQLVGIHGQLFKKRNPLRMCKATGDFTKQKATNKLSACVLHITRLWPFGQSFRERLVPQASNFTRWWFDQVTFIFCLNNLAVLKTIRPVLLMSFSSLAICTMVMYKVTTPTNTLSNINLLRFTQLQATWLWLSFHLDLVITENCILYVTVCKLLLSSHNKNGC